MDLYHPPNITEINRHIAKYNDMQLVLNEYTFGPLQNDSVIIVVQVSKLILIPLTLTGFKSRKRFHSLLFILPFF